MSIFLSLKLTERLGIWFEIEPFRQWKRQVYNYATLGEGRCRYVILGPISIGCNHPDSKAEAEQRAHCDNILKRLAELEKRSIEIPQKAD